MSIQSVELPGNAPPTVQTIPLVDIAEAPLSFSATNLVAPYASATKLPAAGVVIVLDTQVEPSVDVAALPEPPAPPATTYTPLPNVISE